MWQNDLLPFTSPAITSDSREAGGKQGACSGKLQAEDLHSSPSFNERVPTSEAGPGDISLRFCALVPP